jgi:hypothetical protein
MQPFPDLFDQHKMYGSTERYGKSCAWKIQKRQIALFWNRRISQNLMEKHLNQILKDE